VAKAKLFNGSCIPVLRKVLSIFFLAGIKKIAYLHFAISKIHRLPEYRNKNIYQ
jgi:hypothetical protein